MDDTPMDAGLDVENAQRLGELLAVLAGASAPDAPAVSLDTLDGYLTALRVGPDEASPVRAMDELFGEDWPAALEAQAQTEAFMDALHLRWNEIGDALDPQPLLDAPEQMHLMPLISEFDEETKERLVAEGAISADLLASLPAPGVMWAQGFLQAVDDSGNWTTGDEDASRDLGLMLEAVEAVTLEEGSTPRSEYIAGAYEETDGIDQNALIDDMLFTVQDLSLFWMQQRTLKQAIAGMADPGASH